MKALLSIMAWLAPLTAFSSVQAQMFAPTSPRILRPIIGGVPAACTDPANAPVYTVFDPATPDVAQSFINPANGMRFIRINVQLLGSYPSLFQIFIYAHECGHHLSGDIIAGTYLHHDNLDREKNADRIGIRLLRDQLHITESQVTFIASFLRNNPPIPPYYLDGPKRAEWIIACYKTNADDCGTNLAYARDNQTDRNSADDMERPTAQEADAPDSQARPRPRETSDDQPESRDQTSVSSAPERQAPILWPPVNQDEFCKSMVRLIDMAQNHFSELAPNLTTGSGWKAVPPAILGMGGTAEVIKTTESAEYEQKDKDSDFVDIIDHVGTCLAGWTVEVHDTSISKLNKFFFPQRHVAVTVVTVTKEEGVAVFIEKERIPLP